MTNKGITRRGFLGALASASVVAVLPNQLVSMPSGDYLLSDQTIVLKKTLVVPKSDRVIISRCKLIAADDFEGDYLLHVQNLDSVHLDRLSVDSSSAPNIISCIRLGYADD